MNLQEINAGIRGLATRTRNARTLAGTLAIAIMEHAQEHGDCTPAPRLCRALDTRMRKLMVNYFAAFSPVKVTLGKTAADDKVKFADVGSKTYNPFNLDGARAKNWWDEADTDKPEEIRDLNYVRTKVNKLIESIEKMVKDSKVVAADSADILADMKAIRLAIAGRGQVIATPLARVA